MMYLGGGTRNTASCSDFTAVLCVHTSLARTLPFIVYILCAMSDGLESDPYLKMGSRLDEIRWGEPELRPNMYTSNACTSLCIKNVCILIILACMRVHDCTTDMYSIKAGIQKLKSLGIDKDTIVTFSLDNGGATYAEQQGY